MSGKFSAIFSFLFGFAIDLLATPFFALWLIGPLYDLPEHDGILDRWVFGLSLLIGSSLLNIMASAGVSGLMSFFIWLFITALQDKIDNLMFIVFLIPIYLIFTLPILGFLSKHWLYRDYWYNKYRE
jgi:hypothetical protein